MYDAKYMVIVAVPRYQEDAWVNGAREPEAPAVPRMPGLIAGTFELWIDLDLCRIAYWPEGTLASIHYKICDDGSYTLLDGDGQIVDQHNGYVPRNVSPAGLGDYLILTIDGAGHLYDDFPGDDFAAWVPSNPWAPSRFRRGLQIGVDNRD